RIARSEAMAEAFELLLQLAEVVDFAVRDDLDVAGLVQDRLLPAGEIDDGEAAHAESDTRQRDAALFVGAAVMQHLHHAGEIVNRDGPIELSLNNPDDPTHALRLFPVARHLCRYTGGDRKLRDLADHDGARSNDGMMTDRRSIGKHH